jgi:hypothetical protein
MLSSYVVIEERRKLKRKEKKKNEKSSQQHETQKRVRASEFVAVVFLWSMTYCLILNGGLHLNGPNLTYRGSSFLIYFAGHPLIVINRDNDSKTC